MSRTRLLTAGVATVLALGALGGVTGVAAGVLSSVFLGFAIRVGFRKRGEDDRMKPEKQLFGYSVIYLFALFAALVADRWLLVQG